MCVGVGLRKGGGGRRFDQLTVLTLPIRRGWLGEANVSCILRHQDVQLRLAYSWTRHAILVAGKGSGGML